MWMFGCCKIQFVLEEDWTVCTEFSLVPLHTALGVLMQSVGSHVCICVRVFACGTGISWTSDLCFCFKQLAVCFPLLLSDIIISLYLHLFLRLSTGEGDGAWCPLGSVFPSGSEYLQVGCSSFSALICRCTYCSVQLLVSWKVLIDI